VTAWGGTEAGGAIDFATPCMRHMLGVIGITDVEVIAANPRVMREDAAGAARQAVECLAARRAHPPPSPGARPAPGDGRLHCLSFRGSSGCR
jgi:hypothetical protein